MRKIARNTFEQGVVMETNPYDAPSTAATMAHNMRIRRAGKNFVMETESGNVRVGAIKPGYVPLAVQSINGVAYILSHDPVSKSSELGTYPSPPAGGHGPLLPVYKALQNYTPTGDPAHLGDFNSPLFGFSLDHPVTMKLQPSYDGTVNIILTDGQNAGLLVNSGFRVNGRVAIEMMSVRAEQKYYVPANFSNTLQLIQKSGRMLGVAFGGVAPGGKLPAGTYRAYFKLASYDDNETEVVAESQNITVGFGNTVATTRGGKTNEPTDKRILFRLSNIDTSFAYLKVYLSYAAGDLEPVTTVYQLSNPYPITADTMELVLTGFEQMATMNAEELSLSYANIESFRTMEQTHNRLFPANVKTKVRDYAVLQRFAQRILLGHREKQLSVPSATDDKSLSRLFTENTLSTTETGQGYVGGYYNPNNIYHYTGYWGGEGYPFGLQFIFDDGSLSPAFPVIGIDNVGNDKVYSSRDTGFKQQVANLIAGKGGWDTREGLNDRGVYRFPNRNEPGASYLLQNGYAHINGITYQFPPMEDAEFAEIRRLTIGCQFVAGERKADVITQGYLVPTVSALRAEKPTGYTHLDTAFEKEENLKYIPAPFGAYEGAKYERGPLKDKVSVIPMCFAPAASQGQRPIVQKKRYAFYSSDLMADESKYGPILNTDLRREIKLLHTAQMRATGQVNTGTDVPGLDKCFTVAMANWTDKYTGATQQGRTSFVAGFSGLYNQQQFSSEARYLAGVGQKEETVYTSASFNSYVGVQLEKECDPLPIMRIKINGFSHITAYPQPIYENEQLNVAYNANIYSGEKQLDREQLRDRYNSLVGIAYRPISPRLYWDDSHPYAGSTNTLASRLDAQGKVTLFGGDCFINLSMRRISINNYHKPEDEAFKVNTGFTLQVCNEGNTNAAFRNTELFDVNEKFEKGYDRSFLPYFASTGDPNTLNERENSLRTYRLPESKAYNPGFHRTRSDKQYIPFLQNVPFVETIFDNRVYYSSQHLNNAFSNGYRHIMLSAFQDFPKHLGSINRLVTLNGSLFMVTDHSISVLSVNERVTAANDSAGPIFIAPASVIGPLVGSVTEEYGSHYPFGVTASDNYVYGVDTANNCIWRTHQGRQLELISDNYVREHLEKFTGVFAAGDASMLLRDVRTYYHKDKKDLIFVFYYRIDGGMGQDPFLNEHTFTLVYNEDTGLWQGTRGFTPAMMFTIGDDLYSFNAKRDTNLLYRHFAADIDGQPNYATFYDEPQESFFEFVVSGDTEGEKLFDTVRLVSNNTLPVRLEMLNDLGTYEQVINNSRDITRRNTTIEKEEVVIILKKQQYARLRDKYLKVRVVYNHVNKALISSINTIIRNF